MTLRPPLSTELRKAYRWLRRENPAAAQAWVLRWCADPEAAQRELRTVKLDRLERRPR